MEMSAKIPLDSTRLPELACMSCERSQKTQKLTGKKCQEGRIKCCPVFFVLNANQSHGEIPGKPVYGPPAFPFRCPKYGRIAEFFQCLLVLSYMIGSYIPCTRFCNAGHTLLSM